MALSAQISLSIISHETTSGDISSQMRVTPATYAIALADGTGVNQAQVAWSSSSTASGSSADELVMQSLSDDRGAVSLSAVKAIYIRNKSTLYRLSITIDNWTSLDTTVLPFNLLIPAGGACVYMNPTAAGWATTASSAMLLIAEGEGQSVEYDIMLIGEGTVS
jgi:hypothetical protein